MARKRGLPKRFQPYLRQATAQADLQFGGQGDLLAQLLTETGRDYTRSVRQARGGAETLRSGVDQARSNLAMNLNAAGLDMNALAGTDDGRRISQTYAGALNELDLRRAQADEYAASGVRQAGEAYTDAAGQIRTQLSRLVKDRGTYTASLLDELIEGDRNARRTARQEAREQSFEAGQNALDRDTRLRSSIIGQNINPDTGAILNPRKDRNSTGSKPKLTAGQQLTAQGGISSAIAQAKRLRKEGRSSTEALQILTEGRDKVSRTVFKDSKGNRVPEYIQQTDARGNPKRVKNPAIVSEENLSVPKVPSFQDLYARAAVEAQYNNGGRLSPETVKALRKAGIRVKSLGVRLPGSKSKAKYPTPRNPTAPDGFGGSRRT